MKIYAAGLVISQALFFVFCGLFLLGTEADRKLFQLGSSSTAPENLRRAAESLRFRLAIEKHSINGEDILNSESWKLLEKRLSDYADRIELLREQRRFRNSVVMWSYLAAAFSMLFFSIARKREKSRQTQQNAAEQPASRSAVKNKDNFNH